MKPFIQAIIAALFTLGLATQAFADCNNDTPRQSEIWAAFTKFVGDNYLVNAAESGAGYRQYAFGHAAGRLAIAVNNDAEKKQALECVLYGIDQEFAMGFLVTGDDRIFKEAMEASMGMHNDIVSRVYRVTDTSPIGSVFDEALRMAGRTSTNPNYGRNTNYYGIPISDGNQTIISSTAPSRAGTNTNCTTGDRWSLAQADTHFRNASILAESVPGTCSGDNWYTCRDIQEELRQAYDHTFQTADQNHDGIAKCKLCNFDAAIRRAERLPVWEDWLRNRYYGGGGGLSNIYYTLQDMNRDPVCRLNTQSPTPAFPPPPVYDDPPEPIRRADKFPPINSTYWVLSETRVEGKGNTAISGCQHQAGKIQWNKAAQGSAEITYNTPPTRLEPGEKFTITANGNVNLTKDAPPYPSFELVVSGRRINSAATVISMNRTNTKTGLRYSKNGQKTYSAPSNYNSIDEFEIVFSDDWCPKVLFVYKKGN